MNRVIKFRAWNVGQKEMFFYDPKEYGYEMRGDECITDAPLSLLVSDENWKVMQYTGLKDRKGKEIYEGDIVEDIIKEAGEYNNQTIVYRGVVEWAGGERGYMFKTEWVKGIMSIDAPTYMSTINRSFKDKVPFKVIGNIYQNPELRKL